MSDDDEATISLPVRGSLPGCELMVPPFTFFDLRKMQIAVSDMLHAISESLIHAGSLQEGPSLEENTVQNLMPSQSFVDLLHYILQSLIRTVGEEQHRALSGTSHEATQAVLPERSSKKTSFLLALLKEMIISLDADESQHQHIFREFVKCLFIYVAQSLHLLEFAHSEMDNVEYQIEQSAHLDFESIKRENEQIYAIQSIIIIKVLENMLLLAPTFYGNDSETSYSCISYQTCPIKESIKQIIFCKRHLQDVLAEIMFGYTSNLKFEELSINLTVSKYQLGSCFIKDLCVAQWFKRSLGLLVGWDFLQLIPSRPQEESDFFGSGH